MEHLQSRKFWLMWAGYLIAFTLWYVSVKWLPLASFARPHAAIDEGQFDVFHRRRAIEQVETLENETEVVAP